MLNNLKKKNPDIEVYSVFDDQFKRYGSVLENIDVSKICEAANKIEMPEEGVRYVPSEPSFETLEIANLVKKQVYGGVDSQLGYCWGYNTMLNATEWHTCDEVNIAVTPIVLLLGNLWDVKEDKIDSSKFKAFYVPEGTTVKMFSSTLHYTPCQVCDDGFRCVVGLIKNTNTELDFDAIDKKLISRNKWLISHIDNDENRSQGFVMGVTGVNFDIKY